MNVTFLPRAEKDLRKLPKVDQIAVARKIRLLSQPIIANEEKLAGFINGYRVRVGNYRIIYRKTKMSVDIVIIAHRKEVYKLLQHVFH